MNLLTSNTIIDPCVSMAALWGLTVGGAGIYFIALCGVRQLIVLINIHCTWALIACVFV